MLGGKPAAKASKKGQKDRGIKIREERQNEIIRRNTIAQIAGGVLPSTLARCSKAMVERPRHRLCDCCAGVPLALRWSLSQGLAGCAWVLHLLY